MKIYNLSVVNIVPEADRQRVNDFAELMGCGADNLSVRLLDKDGNVFYACHSFWDQGDYDLFKTLESGDALVNLYERVVVDGDAQTNWLAALEELGLALAPYVEPGAEDTPQIPETTEPPPVEGEATEVTPELENRIG